MSCRVSCARPLALAALSLVVGLWSAPSLRAQVPGPPVAGPPVPADAVTPGSPPGSPPTVAKEAKEASVPKEGALGTLLADGSKLRCWPTANSPTYEDALVKGVVVGVGRSEGGFRQVRLPFGPLGFVHKKFAGEMAAGRIATKGKAVAFRYRPKSGEAPVTSLGEGTELWVVGVQDDWWRVRNPAIECWLPEAEVQVFDQPPETMQKAFAELQKVQEGEVQGYLAAIAARKEEARLEAERRAQLLAVQDRLADELKKPPAEQALDPIAAAADELLQDLPAGSALREGVQELQKRIAAQKWVVEATAVRDAEPVPPKDLQPLPPADVKDPLERFQAVGFLRWEKGFTGPGHFVVERGGQRLYLVSCNSGRYDLGLFVDAEVGLIGPRRRPATESLRVLDVERIEVLSPRR